MSVPDELVKRLDDLKRVSIDFNNLVSSIEGKKMMKENDVTRLEKQIEKLKSESDEASNKAALIIRKADDYSTEKINFAKKMLEEAQIEKAQASDDKKKAQLLMNEATALMAQAVQRQKEADNVYRQYEEKRNKMQEVLR